jgi:hypothetical protein
MSTDDKRPLGRIQLQRKLVPRELRGALREQPAPDAEPPSSTQPVVVRDAEADELMALAELAGVPGLDLRELTIILSHLDVVPREAAVALRILPVLLGESLVYLAMADPRDKRAVDEVEFVSGKTVHPFVAVQDRLIRTIAAAYDAKAVGQRQFRVNDG